jgi:hypothetical protein
VYIDSVVILVAVAGGVVQAHHDAFGHTLLMDDGYLCTVA